MWVCACVRVCLCAFVRVCLCVCVCVCACVRISVCACVRICASESVRMCNQSFTQRYVHLCTCMYTSWIHQSRIEATDCAYTMSCMHTLLDFVHIMIHMIAALAYATLFCLFGRPDAVVLRQNAALMERVRALEMERTLREQTVKVR